MRRFQINITDHGHEDRHRIVKATVRDVCKDLSEFPSLGNLHNDLHERSDFRVLESFTLQRNVQKVFLEGAPPVYRQYLTSKMTGCSPVDHLPKMFHALEFYAGGFYCCEKNLKEAFEAMENDDVERFKRVRAKIVTLVTKWMADATEHLYNTWPVIRNLFIRQHQL
jgi:hypothetical protein